MSRYQEPMLEIHVPLVVNDTNYQQKILKDNYCSVKNFSRNINNLNESFSKKGHDRERLNYHKNETIFDFSCC